MDSAVLLSTLSASVLGSLHCAGMCGGLVAFQLGQADYSRRFRSHLSYHFGRLVIYLLLGAFAGFVGAGLDGFGALFAWQRPAAFFGGAWMVGWGLVLLYQQRYPSSASASGPGMLARYVAPLYRWIHARPGPGSALILGLLSAFLPCGWLYLFVGAAASQGRPTFGALFMGVFWLGTLPLLGTFGVIVSRLSEPLRRVLPTCAAVILLATGLYTLQARVRMDVIPLFHRAVTGASEGIEGGRPPCHRE